MGGTLRSAERGASDGAAAGRSGGGCRGERGAACPAETSGGTPVRTPDWESCGGVFGGETSARGLFASGVCGGEGFFISSAAAGLALLMARLRWTAPLP